MEHPILDITTESSTRRTISHMVHDLEEGNPTRVEIMCRGVDIGYTELSIERYRQQETNSLQQVEIRWIYIAETYRNFGYLSRTLNFLQMLGLPLIGEISEEELREVWEKVGATFLNDWDFIIMEGRR